MFSEKAGLRIGTVREGKDLLEKDPILRRIVEVIVKEIDPDRIVLFGSRARGDYNEGSDYDILVLKEGIRPEERRPLQRKIRRALWKEDIYSSAAVDVIVQNTRRYEDLKERWDLIYYDADKEGVILYERKGKRVVEVLP